MDTPDALEAEDLPTVIASMNALIEKLDLDHEVIDFDKITYATGIPNEVVRAVLSGDDVDLDSLSTPFDERLRFLLETRRRPDGSKYTQAEIAQSIGLSERQIGNLVHGRRGPSVPGSVSLEGFFQLPPGFFTMTWSQALLRELEPVLTSLEHFAIYAGVGVPVRLRSSGLVATDPRLRDGITSALSTAAYHSRGLSPAQEDPEIREVADSMRSLPANRRRSVLSVVRGILGLADSAPDDPEHARNGR
ncbi:hypothetical protein GCM10020000_86550 [Streptomyces olivoverticillatus]